MSTVYTQRYTYTHAHSHAHRHAHDYNELLASGFRIKKIKTLPNNIPTQKCMKSGSHVLCFFSENKEIKYKLLIHVCLC